MPRVKWDGDATTVVRAQEAMAKSAANYKETVKESVSQAKLLDAAAQRIAENISPQDKYNRKMAELKVLVDSGRLSLSQAEAAAKKYGDSLDRAGKTGDKAFGPSALQSVGQMALGVMGVSSALDLVVNAFRAVNQEQKQAAELAMRARMGIGQLSQLAASAPDATGKITAASQAAAMKALVAETDSYLAMGAAEDRNAAANLTFDLNSSGLSEKDRGFAAQLRARGVLQDVAGLGQAYDASVTALGAKEVGTFEQFASKAIAAGSVSPGTIQQLPLALTRAGADAKKLGLTDEFLLSAGAYLAKEAGSPEEGATKLGALLAGMNKSGVDLKGMTGAQMIERLAKENTGYGGIFKDNREAVNAFGTVRDNLTAIWSLQQNVESAQSQGLARQSLELPNIDPATGAANVAAGEQGRYQREIVKHFAERESLSDAIRTAEAGGDIKRGRWWPQRWANSGLNATTDALGGDDFLINSARTVEKNAPGTYLPETMNRIEAYLKRNNELMEQQNKVMQADSATSSPSAPTSSKPAPPPMIRPRSPVPSKR